MFSVVIPFYDRPDLLAQALGSVLSQTFPANEVVVVIDNSYKENLGNLIDYFPWVKWHFSVSPGPGGARNTGVSVASNDWIAFLDADDLWLPDHLQVISHTINSINKSAKSVITTRPFIWNNSEISPINIIRKKSTAEFKNITLFDAITYSYINSSSFAVHKSTISSIGGYGETYYGEDLDLYVRLYAFGTDFILCDTSTSIYRKRLGSLMTRARSKAWTGEREDFGIYLVSIDKLIKSETASASRKKEVKKLGNYLVCRHWRQLIIAEEDNLKGARILEKTLYRSYSIDLLFFKILCSSKLPLLQALRFVYRCRQNFVAKKKI